MNIYYISFTARPVGAIGKTWRHKIAVNEDTEDKAIDKIYEDFEHVSEIKVNRVTIYKHFRKDRV